MIPNSFETSRLAIADAQRNHLMGEEQAPAMGNVAAIEATPSVRIARSAPMAPIDSRAPAVERDKYPIAIVGPQRNELLHRRHLSASRSVTGEPSDRGCGRPPFGLASRAAPTIAYSNNTQSHRVNQTSTYLERICQPADELAGALDYRDFN